jgi:rSAM/selenodomain-associated transferase 1
MHVFYGDQAMFVRKDVFRAAGGFPSIPVMEDLELSRRLRKAGKLCVLPGPVVSSGRRWQRTGVWWTSLTHWLITLLYLCGWTAPRIAHLKARLLDEGLPGPSGNALLLFARDPFHAPVKTRLVPAVGESGAGRLYKAFLEDLSDRGRDVPVDLRSMVVAPPGAGREMRTLVGEGYEWWTQRGRDLGERMAEAFAVAFRRGAERVVLTGTDSPTLSRWRIRRAFRLLGRADLVLGPAFDGGYYLVGLRAPQRKLFDLPAWSTGNVLRQTLENARALGLKTRLLLPWYDVDTPTDLRVLRLHLGLAPGAAPATRKALRELQRRLVEEGVTCAEV